MANRIKCMCPTCNAEGVFKFAMPDRGGRHGYLCNWHARHMEGYSFENDIRMGEKKAHEITTSIELETAFTSRQARAELVHFGFVPTSDATVQCEYKSPIYEGFPALSKQLSTIESLKASADVKIDWTCGTHIHIGHWTGITPETMRYLRKFNHELFIPVSNAIMADVEKSARFFGRKPNTWAEPVTRHDFAGDCDGWMMKHESMFNLQHDWTVEFRQAKFVSADQYMKVAHFARKVVEILVVNFVEHYNEMPADTRRYPTIEAYRQHKAEVTAKKLVKAYEKATANI